MTASASVLRTQQHNRAHPAPTALADGLHAAGPRGCDDMTVEVAPAVTAGARVENLFLCDGDDQCTGSITRARLTKLRDSSTYTDRVRLRDVLGGPLTPFPFSL